MHLSHVLTGVWLAVLATSVAAEEPRAAVPRRTAAATPTLLEVVSPAYRESVNEVIKAQSLSVKAVDDEFTAHTRVYEWMLDHPDRVSLAWQRLKVQCIEITDLGDGRFRWVDETNGSELTWRPVGKFADGLVWYATGKVKPGALLPMVPVKAVAVLHYPKTAETKSGVATFLPSLNVYMHTDSKAAGTILRIVGPAAPRMAEQGAEQLLLFFSGPARHLYKHPEQAETLLAPKAK